MINDNTTIIIYGYMVIYDYQVQLPNNQNICL